MRSGTSFFNGTVFKKTVLRFWPLWGTYSALWLVSLPLAGLALLRLEANAQTGLTGGYMKNFAENTVLSAADQVTPFALVFGLLAAMAAFSHLYSARPANLFGSLPVRREGLFLSHYLAGLSFIVVPNTVVFLLTLLIEGVGGYVDARGLLFWLGVSCGEYFFFYSLAVFCGMFTGHILALPVFYGIVNLFAYGIYGLLYVVMHVFYYGFAGFGGWTDMVVEALTPAICLGQEVGHYWYGEEHLLVLHGLELVGGYALAAAVLAACSFFLYRARRLESAGDVVSVRPMRPVFKYGMAICVGLVFGVGTATVMVGGGEPVLMTAMLFWGVAGYFAAQMLLDKSFRVFKKWKGAAVVSGVFVLLFLVVGLDLTGYETRVPRAADVESVHVDGLDAVRFSDDGDRMQQLNIEDPEQIALLTALHQAAVAQRDGNSFGEGISASLTLEYALKGGGTLKRNYAVWLNLDEAEQEGSSAWIVQQLYQDRELCWRVYGFDKLEEEITRGRRLDSVEFSHYNPMWGTDSCAVGYGVDARALLDAVEEDLLAGRIGVRSVTYNQVFQSGETDCLIFRVVDPSDGEIRYSVSIALQDTASSTLAVLKELAKDVDLSGEHDEALRNALQTALEE